MQGSKDYQADHYLFLVNLHFHRSTAIRSIKIEIYFIINCVLFLTNIFLFWFDIGIRDDTLVIFVGFFEYKLIWITFVLWLLENRAILGMILTWITLFCTLLEYICGQAVFGNEQLRKIDSETMKKETDTASFILFRLIKKI